MDENKEFKLCFIESGPGKNLTSAFVPSMENLSLFVERSRETVSHFKFSN